MEDINRSAGGGSASHCMQRRTTYWKIAACIVVEAGALPSGEALLDHSLAWLEPRLHLAPHLRRKLVRVPLELDHPVWIEHPHFDLEYHVRHAALPAPQPMDQLGDPAGRLLSHPLD